MKSFSFLSTIITLLLWSIFWIIVLKSDTLLKTTSMSLPTFILINSLFILVSYFIASKLNKN